MKTIRPAWMDDRLHSYIVTFDNTQRMQFWAEDRTHAHEQAEDAEPSLKVTHIERATEAPE